MYTHLTLLTNFSIAVSLLENFILVASFPLTCTVSVMYVLNKDKM